jgi:2-hydroxyglutaryl-CoA dehydratase, D-component
MSSTSPFLQRIATLHRDPLAVARKAAADGRRVVGYLSAHIPVELLLAANAVPVRLRGPAGTPTPRANDYLESSFSPESFAICELFLAGQLDFLDAIVFPRSNDSAQRLYYYLCELQRRKKIAGPTLWLYDVATIARETSKHHTLESTKQLAASLGVDVTQLPNAVDWARRRAKLISQLSNSVIENRVLGSEAQRIVRASEFDWAESFDSDLAAWLATKPKGPSRKAILFAGSAPPDDRLHLAVEAAGGTIACDLTDTQIEFGGSDVSIEALAERHQHATSPAQAMARNANWLTNKAQASNTRGAILWLIEEDESLPWELAGQARTLIAANVQVLKLARQTWLANDETLAQIKTFVQTIAEQN